MSERRELKKKLAKWKHYRSNLPRLIDCSQMYGDNTYTQADIKDADKVISGLEKQIADLTPNQPKQ